MTLKRFSRMLGRLWGRMVVFHGVAWLRQRAARFDLVVYGGENLRTLAGRPFVVTSNHLMPIDTPLGLLVKLPFVRQYQHSADSFIFHRAVREQAGRTLHTAARCDGGRWAKRAWKRQIQKRIGQPFAWGQMEVLPGYIPVEQSPGCWQRPFVEDVREAVTRGEALLVFPGGITLDRPDLDPRTHPGAAHIARRHALPILPACILGSDSWAPGHPVTIAFGSAFIVDEMTKEEVSAEIIRRIQALHASYVTLHRHRAQGVTQAALPQADAPEAPHVAAI